MHQKVQNGRHQKKPKQDKYSHGKEHMGANAAGMPVAANDSQFADPQSAHMAPRPLLIRD